MKVMKFFHTADGVHYMPVIWLSLGDQVIIIGEESGDKTVSNDEFKIFVFSINLRS